MKSLTAKQASQKLAANIFLIIGILGVAACVAPWVFDISVEDGGGALVAIGGMIALIGLMSSRVFFNRARELKAMASGEGILGRWTYDSPQDAENRAEFGEVVIGLSGVYAEGEFYAFNAFTCRLERASMIEGPNPQIIFELSLAHKHGRHRQELRVPVPGSWISVAANIVAHLNHARASASK